MRKFATVDFVEFTKSDWLVPVTPIMSTVVLSGLGQRLVNSPPTGTGATRAGALSDPVWVSDPMVKVQLRKDQNYSLDELTLWQIWQT